MDTRRTCAALGIAALMAVGAAPAALAQGTGTVGPAGTARPASTTTGSTGTGTGSTSASTGTTQTPVRDESPPPWGLLGLLGLAGLAPLFMRRYREEAPAARSAPRPVA